MSKTPVKTQPLSYIQLTVGQSIGSPVECTRAHFTRAGRRRGLGLVTHSYPRERRYLTPASTARLEHILERHSDLLAFAILQQSLEITLWPAPSANKGDQP